MTHKPPSNPGMAVIGWYCQLATGTAYQRGGVETISSEPQSRQLVLPDGFRRYGLPNREQRRITKLRPSSARSAHGRVVRNRRKGRDRTLGTLRRTPSESGNMSRAAGNWSYRLATPNCQGRESMRIALALFGSERDKTDRTKRKYAGVCESLKHVQSSERSWLHTRETEQQDTNTGSSCCVRSEAFTTEMWHPEERGERKAST